MKLNYTRGKFKILLATLVLLTSGLTTWAQESKTFSINDSPLPAPTGFVNDYAGVIDTAAKQRLEDQLKQFKEKTNPSVEIAVAVVRTTGDRQIFDYSLAVARGWKIGSKADDNPSALLLVAIDDRKYFTQVSKDLEDELPDGVVGNIQRQKLVPEFRKGNYSKGISDTVEAYIATIESKGSGASPTPAVTGSKPISDAGTPIFSTFCCGLIIFIIILIVISRSNRGGPNKGDRDRWGGGGFGSGGGSGSALPWIIGSILAGSGSSSGSSSGGWGGSSGGGGFGGFGGGGDFGGGGAGGDW
ncbi:MAG: TPM domain-containing protein [Pyrinomonadaceae bacterium]